MTTRPLPQSPESERAVLGGLMLDPERLSDIADMLEPGDFYREAHQKLFRLMLDMARKGEPCDALAVFERAAEDADAFGGHAYFTALPDGVPSTENLEYYAAIIQRRALARRLVEAGKLIADKALEDPDEPVELRDFAEATVFVVTQTRQSSTWSTMAQLAPQRWAHHVAAHEDPDSVSGMPTGFTDLDTKLAGLKPTKLYILAARPAMGKTSLALDIARNVALSGVGVGIFSLEMGKSEVVDRQLCSHGKVNAGRMRTASLTGDDWQRLQESTEALAALPVYIDDTPALTLMQLRSKARRMKRADPGLGLIVIDYIGLMQGSGRRGESRQEQISEISRGLKLVAKELDIATLALSQLNRGCEQRPNKRPLLSDLRDSGAIEQDADCVMFIYRDEVYNPETTTEPGVAEVIVAKQRGGSTGTVKLAFLGQYTRFENLAHVRVVRMPTPADFGDGRAW